LGVSQLSEALRQRFEGERPSALRAGAAATVAGAATALFVYRLLRS
jgi:hypothetical protein